MYIQHILRMPMSWLQDTGILRKLALDEYNPPPPDPLPTIRVNEPLTVYQLGTAAMVCAAGLVTAAIAFLGELIFG